jgi:hypothetical protein
MNLLTDNVLLGNAIGTDAIAPLDMSDANG